MSQEQLPDIRTVVIAMDGSKFSKFAFQFYLENLHGDNDKVFLVHSVEIFDALTSPMLYTAPYATNRAVINSMIEEEQEKTKRKLEDFAKLLKDNKMQGTVKSIHAAKPGEGIVQVAKDVHASLIVIGSRGLGKIRRTFIGSVSDFVVHHADVPVVVCRPKEQ